MALDVLAAAKKMMRRRQFDKAITILQSRAEIYEDNFDYYLLFAIACLYVGDTGTASAYFQKARKIKITDTMLLTFLHSRYNRKKRLHPAAVEIIHRQ